MCGIMWHCVSSWGSVWICRAVCGFVRQCVALWGSVEHCEEVCGIVRKRVALLCSVWHCRAVCSIVTCELVYRVLRSSVWFLWGIVYRYTQMHCILFYSNALYIIIHKCIVYHYTQMHCISLYTNALYIIMRPEWPHWQGACLACWSCKIDYRVSWDCTDSYYARGARGVLSMRVGVSTS